MYNRRGRTTIEGMFGNERLEPREYPLEPRHIFPFFKLPPELRSMIYDELLNVGLPITTDKYTLHSRVRNVLLNNPTFVSKQFHDELAQRLTRQPPLRGEIIIEDRPENISRSLYLPDPFAFITRLEIHLALACQSACHGNPPGCRMPNELKVHADTLTPLRFMTHLAFMSLSFYLQDHDFAVYCERACLQYLLCKNPVYWALVHFARASRSFSCDVYRSDFGGMDWDFAGDKMLVMTYSAESRTLIRVDSDLEEGDVSGESSIPLDGSLVVPLD